MAEINETDRGSMLVYKIYIETSINSYSPATVVQTKRLSMEGDSVRLYECLDLLGYSQKMIQYRRDINKKMDDIHNTKPFLLEAVTTGAKAEGTALYCESDIDRLYVIKDAICLETVREDSTSFVFQVDYSDCSPGYCMVKLIKKVENSKCAQHVLPFVDKDTGYLTNSVSFFSEFPNVLDVNGDIVYKRDKRGPSASYSNNFIDYDIVKGIICECPTLIEKWINRTRIHQWPDRILTEGVSKLEAHIVPVACRCSNLPSLEWRICFTKAELLLMNSFNDIESKVYVLLKLIAKSVLKPICSEMTSYIMKNVMFWMKEKNPPEYFVKQHLLERLLDALIFLKCCIKRRRLESYMIAERNLVEGRITDDECTQLSDIIEQLLREKMGMFIRVDKLRNAFIQMEISPNLFQKHNEIRNEIEMLVYRKNIIFREIDAPVDRSQEEFREALTGDERFKRLNRRLNFLVLQYDGLMRDGNANWDELFKSRLRHILS